MGSLCSRAQGADPIQGPSESVQSCLEVRNAVMATTTVEFLSDSSNQTLKIAGILQCHNRAQEGEEAQQLTPVYLVGAHRGNCGLCWNSTLVGHALQQLRDVSIPNNVRELCARCFRECKSLRRVMFGCSSSLERIGFECFAFTGVEDVSIPDSVRELCDRCFS